MMISIVMPYYNRLSLLRHTLSTIKLSRIDDVEIIIVDDFSNEENSVDAIPHEFSSLNIKVIKMAAMVATKYYCNPCIPFNVGFRQSVGDLIVLQNPECCHIGDVLSYVAENLSDENYLSFHCFASTKEQLEKLHHTNTISISDNHPVTHQGDCWYVHNIHRPMAWHFTSAISRNNLKKLNGFDERFAFGRGGDDVEFLYRIQHLDLQIQFVDSPYVVHQWHPKDTSASYDMNISTKINSEISYETKLAKLIYAPNHNSI